MQRFLRSIISPSILLGCLFPFFMAFIELILKQGSTTSEHIAFFGPSLASAGVGFLLPLTTLKPIQTKIPASPEALKKAEGMGISLSLTRDTIFSGYILVLLFVFIAIWIGSVVLSSQYPNYTFLKLPLHLWLGLINYFTGVILTAIKEVI